jgi:hypothetical protein
VSFYELLKPFPLLGIGIIAAYASPWSSPPTPQHLLPGGRYPLPGPDSHRLERASLAGRTSP